MSQQTKTAAQAAAKKRPGSDQEAMPFQRKNYRLLILGSLLLILGYALLQAPSHFVDAREFSLALYVAPVVITGGFGVLLYAIIAK
jgi:hypothetical protein